MQTQHQQAHKHVTPKLEHKHDVGKEFTIEIHHNDSEKETEISSGADDKVNAKTFHKCVIEFKEHS